MRGLKSHFVFNRSERNGIFLLVLLIILVQFAVFLEPFSQEEPLSPAELEELLHFQKQVDSLKKVAISKDTVQRYPFNPNFITDQKAYALGMSVEEIDKLHSFRAQDKWVNSAEDFQKVTGVSDSLLKVISVSFRFPEWTRRSTDEGNRRTTVSQKQVVVKDLNEASIEDLKEINGIGEVLSARIVRYRESIGGFAHEDQLHDVYGLDSAVVERTKSRFRVTGSLAIQKQDLNTVSLKSLLEIPGLGYELSREIIKYREMNEKIRSFDDLLNIKDFPRDKINRIKLYLTISNENENID